jgi:hypothetical protein
MQERSIQRSIQHALYGLLCVLAATCWFASGATAAVVTYDERRMDQIFAQASLDIRFNPTVSLFAPSLLSIDSQNELDQLFALGTVPELTVKAFFVDAINYCTGQDNASVIGCGEVSGNNLMLSSVVASGSLGPELFSHELGHNLGLEHVSQATPNLMNGALSGSTVLTAEQILTIRNSPLVHQDAASRFVTITPFAVIPEPTPDKHLALGLATWLLVLGVTHATRPARRVKG